LPSTLGAQVIYGGQFRINGQRAEMQILASRLPLVSTMRLLKDSVPESQLRYRLSDGTALGKIMEGLKEKRFLMTSLGDRNSCLVFLLEGGNDAFVRSRPQIPWPSSLPVLDPLQSPQLVVEHEDNHFVFACVTIPSSRCESVLQSCRERLRSEGWDTIPANEEAAAKMIESGFAVLGGSTKICWLEARPGALPNQTVVTLVSRVR